MRPPRWTVGHLVAIVELTCAVAVVAWFLPLGFAAGSPGRSPVDRAFPFVVAAVAALVLGRWSVRSWRAADEEARRPPRRPRTSPPPSEEPEEPQEARQPQEAREEPVVVPLSAQCREAAAGAVAALAAHGVFAPEVPDVDDLAGPLADYGEPVTAADVLHALDEAAWYRPGFDAAAYRAHLAFHVSHGEQFEEVLHEQAADLVRLAGGGLADVTVDVAQTPVDGSAQVPTRVRITADGGERVRAYAGAGKYLSTELHVALAQVLRGRRAGRRLAWLWDDQGVWLTALPDGDVARLNAALGPAAGEGWEWVDEQEPVAAGDDIGQPSGS